MCIQCSWRYVHSLSIPTQSLSNKNSLSIPSQSSSLNLDTSHDYVEPQQTLFLPGNQTPFSSSIIILKLFYSQRFDRDTGWSPFAEGGHPHPQQHPAHPCWRQSGLHRLWNGGCKQKWSRTKYGPNLMKITLNYSLKSVTNSRNLRDNVFLKSRCT